MVNYDTYVQVNEKIFNEHMKEFAKEIREKTEFKTEKLRYIRVLDERYSHRETYIVLADNVPVARVRMFRNGYTGGTGYSFETLIFEEQHRISSGLNEILKSYDTLIKYMYTGCDAEAYIEKRVEGLVK